jgi:hypothetical protein
MLGIPAMLHFRSAMVFLHHKAMDRLGGVFAILYRLHGQILSGFYAVPPSENARNRGLIVLIDENFPPLDLDPVLNP